MHCGAEELGAEWVVLQSGTIGRERSAEGLIFETMLLGDALSMAEIA